MRVVALVLCLLLISCGGGGNPGGPTPPSNPNRITITSSGVSPRELTVSLGARVLFINNDARRHDMTSDQHPDHLDCTEINAVGVLNPGQSRETGNLVIARTCGFHDHEDADNTSLQGRIIVR